MKKNIGDPFFTMNMANKIEKASRADISTYDDRLDDLTGITSKGLLTVKRTPQLRQGMVIMLTSRSIGEDNELGRSMFRDFLKESLEFIYLPEYLIFTNTAVKALLEDKILLRSVKVAKKHGIKVVISKESVAHFKLGAQINFAYKLSTQDIATIVLLSQNFIQI